ncbi:MAG: nitroreductase family protein [Armatimonadota bacterium]
MEFRTVVETRGSVRQFAKDAIPREDLREMVRLAGLAPSVNNAQPWKFVVVTNHELLEKMASAIHSKLDAMLPDDPAGKNAKSKVDWFSTFFVDAPAVIAVLRCPYDAVVDQVLPAANLTHDDINQMRGCPDLQSIGAAIQNLLLAATDLGYGACWLSGPLVARQDLESLLGVSEPWSLAALVAVGRPAGEVRQKEKKPVEEILEFRD